VEARVHGAEPQAHGSDGGLKRPSKTPPRPQHSAPHGSYEASQQSQEAQASQTRTPHGLVGRKPAQPLECSASAAQTPIELSINGGITTARPEPSTRR
jgi:hypothetical protein